MADVKDATYHAPRSWWAGRPTATLTDMIVARLHHITLYHFRGRTSVNSLSLSSIQRFSFVVSSEECGSLQRFNIYLHRAFSVEIEI